LTGEYRQKLLNWFCSVALVLAFAALSPLIYWFVYLPDWIETSLTGEFAEVAGLLGETFLIYPLLLPVILFWHFWDFIQKDASAGRWSLRLAAYRIFVMVVVAAMTLWLLMASGVFTINSCHALDGALYFECYIHQPYWLMLPFLAAVCLALILCIAKAVFSISSHLGKAA